MMVYRESGLRSRSELSAYFLEDISVIAGACPMMFGPGADFGHTCMRWFLKLTGGLPAQGGRP